MSDFSLSRGIHIDAAPEQVRTWIHDLHRWESWSPWHGVDPNMTITYTGADEGAGARQSWSGNRKAGEGAMEVTASTPERVDVRLEFLKPFKATNFVHFDLTPATGGTDVLWTMTGKQNLLMKILYPILRMEKKLGADFDRGLAGLKQNVESAA
jgi:hypothetical protein